MRANIGSRRKLAHAGIAAAFAATCLGGAAAQNPPALRPFRVSLGATPQNVIVRGVTVSQERGAVEVHIASSGELNAAVYRLENPERIVLDLAGAHYAGRVLRIAVHAHDVQSVRVAQFQQSPPVARVVLEMAHRHNYDLLSSGEELTVRVDDKNQPTAEANRAAQTAITAAATIPAPEPQPAAKTAAPSFEVAKNPIEAAPAAPDSAETARDSGQHQAANLDRAATAGYPRTGDEPGQAALLTPPPTIAPRPPEPRLEEESKDTPLTTSDTTAHQAAKENEPLTVRNVTVARVQNGIEILIDATGRLRPVATSLSNPPRIILELANTYCHAQNVAVKSGDVQAVRTWLYLVNPPTTRVEVDLTRSHPFQVISGENRVTLRMEAAPEAGHAGGIGAQAR